MNRRTFLTGSVAAGVSLSTAGCLDTITAFGTGDVVLDEPDYDAFEQVQQAAEDGYIDHPVYGDEFPEVTVSDAFTEREITTTDFVGEQHFLMTFIFTRCPEACPVVTQNLARVQRDAHEQGYEDEFAFLPMTFDPENDTPDVLYEFSEAMGADPDDENWYFLRPDSSEHAREVVEDELGVFYEYIDEDEREEYGNATTEDVDDEFETEGYDPENTEMLYSHQYIIYLVNEDGYVERDYNGLSYIPNPIELVQDVETLRERW